MPCNRFNIPKSFEFRGLVCFKFPHFLNGILTVDMYHCVILSTRTTIVLER